MTISIDGVDITDYIAFQGVKWSRNDIDGPNAGRNMQGSMIRDRVATKIRMDITCRPLTAKEHKTLMGLLYPEFVYVKYNDPMFGNVTKVMYSNNHDSGYCIKYDDDTEYWHNIAFPLIER